MAERTAGRSRAKPTEHRWHDGPAFPTSRKQEKSRYITFAGRETLLSPAYTPDPPGSRLGQPSSSRHTNHENAVEKGVLQVDRGLLASPTNDERPRNDRHPADDVPLDVAKIVLALQCHYAAEHETLSKRFQEAFAQQNQTQRDVYGLRLELDEERNKNKWLEGRLDRQLDYVHYTALFPSGDWGRTVEGLPESCSGSALSARRDVDELAAASEPPTLTVSTAHAVPSSSKGPSRVFSVSELLNDLPPTPVECEPTRSTGIKAPKRKSNMSASRASSGSFPDLSKAKAKDAAPAPATEQRGKAPEAVMSPVDEDFEPVREVNPEGSLFLDDDPVSEPESERNSLFDDDQVLEDVEKHLEKPAKRKRDDGADSNGGPNDNGEGPSSSRRVKPRLRSKFKAINVPDSSEGDDQDERVPLTSHEADSDYQPEEDDDGDDDEDDNFPGNAVQTRSRSARNTRPASPSPVTNAPSAPPSEPPRSEGYKPRYSKARSTELKIVEFVDDCNVLWIITCYKMCKSVKEIWDEWHKGANDNPPLKMLEAVFGTGWRASKSADQAVRSSQIKYRSDWVMGRRMIVRHVERKAKKEGKSVEQVIRKLDKVIDGRIQYLTDCIRNNIEPLPRALGKKK